MMQVKIGSVLVDHSVLISDIADPAILGLDFMRDHNCQINVPLREFIISGHKAQCSSSINSPPVKKLRLDRNFEVNPECQVVIWIKTEYTFPGSCLLRPAPSFEERFSLKVATCLVGKQEGKIPVRLMNLEKTSVQLYQGTVVAILNPVEDNEPILLTREEGTSRESVRKIEVISAYDPCQGGLMQEESSALPSFQIELYQSSITILDNHQRKEVAKKEASVIHYIKTPGNLTTPIIRPTGSFSGPNSLN